MIYLALILGVICGIIMFIVKEIEEYKQRKVLKSTVIVMVDPKEQRRIEKEERERAIAAKERPYLEEQLEALYFQLELLSQLEEKQGLYRSVGSVENLEEKELKKAIATEKAIQVIRNKIAAIELKLERLDG